MLAKGHDFPALTLVGCSTRQCAYSSDFRAAEKLFAQLVQVAGAPGRADKRRGDNPDAFPIILVSRVAAHDFEGWAASQLAERQWRASAFVYQRCCVRGQQEMGFMRSLIRRARCGRIAVHRGNPWLVLPPLRAAPITSSAAIDTGREGKDLQQFLHAWQPLLDALPAQKLRWSLDIDPLEF